TRRDPPYGNLNLKDSKHRDTRDTGRGVQAGAVGSWGGTGRARDGKAASRSASKTRRRSGKVEVSKEETERLLKEQEAEREAKAREDREKLKETRKERKKLKRGGGDDASARESGSRWLHAVQGTGGTVAEMMTPGRVVVDQDDQLGINTGQFDTGEFEVVKSRKELQKERKEQRDQEERAAAERALLKAQSEAAAARRAAQQLAREALKAQREMKRAEARKTEAQRRADAQTKTKAAKDSAAACKQDANSGSPSLPAQSKAAASVTVNQTAEGGSGAHVPAVQTGVTQHPSDAEKAPAAAPSASCTEKATQWTAKSPPSSSP
ncbi:unnamed protein product, partial [Sphacelaria rigidula]